VVDDTDLLAIYNQDELTRKKRKSFEKDMKLVTDLTPPQENKRSESPILQ